MSLDVELVEYLALAADDALKGRDRLIFDLRFGLSDGEPRTLEEVGIQIGVTRERIRQIINRCIRKLKVRANRQRRAGSGSGPCGALVFHLEGGVRPGQLGDFDRLWNLVHDEAQQTRLLIADLVPGEHSMVDQVNQRERQLRTQVRAEARTRQASERFAQLLAAVAWPSTARVLNAMPYRARQRQVSLDGEGHGGSFLSEKMCRDVQFESTLEYAFYLQLEHSDRVVAYQEQPLAIPYELDGTVRRYYPDAFLLLADGRGAVVEIKAKKLLALHENLIKWRALRRFCEQAGYGLLVTDGRMPLQILMRRNVSPAFRSAIWAAMRDGPLHWHEYKVILEQQLGTLEDFLALVLQDGLVWKRQPFTLERPAHAPRA